jgi:putative flavoprotein involved in K+ transport
MRPAQSVEVLVVGAGQAGLAAGYWLRARGLSHLLVERAARVGDSWRNRWDSLRLFTPAAYSSLPGLPLGADPDSFPTKDAMADYLEDYARHFDLPIRLATTVDRLEARDGLFVAALSSGGQIVARSVIVASGPFAVPAVPALAGGLADDVEQLTPNSYRNPERTPAGTVLVVGDGATGRQIALELAASRRVLLATGRPRRVLPERMLGRSIFWWLDRLGVLRATRDSRLGRMLRERDPFPGGHLRLGRLAGQGVVVKPRVAALDGRRVNFADGTAEDITTAIWATGYGDDWSWLAVAGALDEAGRLVEQDGVSQVPGLYTVGRSWQRTRGSALLFGVGDDARLIVDRLAAERATRILQVEAAAAVG